ncbi:hypothetical protein DKX38_007578 [Salix brachista]|uniref:NAC domain-containing protein n=1 Tax=Salix brachista TaxID=2182728 RepID=A0A5N5MNM1_9ROSI|nr:hypothetical protein DKX38_007578 [Salix brachista]
MSNISFVEAKLPPGFRFHPRDEELVCDYLMNKALHCDSLLMVEVDLNKCEPWDIPEAARVGGREWYFYSQRDRKYATGLRTNRATASGYWKATGKDRHVLRKGTLVGMRKTLVFYQGRAPKGKRTDWVMHEFRLEEPLGPPKLSSDKEDWVLCRVFYKNSREAAAKPSTGSCNDDTSSSSLPPLMESYITFEQTQPNSDEHEQVPCFSIFSQNQNLLAPYITPMEVPYAPTMDITNPLDSVSCDTKVLKAVLNNLAKMESYASFKGSPSLGEGSSESYISGVGMSNLWSHHH